jgi:predicted DNA-binding protein
MPRANKGERVVVTARLPVSYYRKLDHYVKVTQETKTDFITDAVMKALDAIEVEDLHPQQERLKLSA